ncbi:hypothetical protein FRB97_004361, partial [Tulasnella sp. 331]
AAAMLEGQDSVFDAWLATYRQKVTQHHRHQLTIWHNPRRSIVEVWVPTSQLAHLPSDTSASNNQVVSSRWLELISNAPNVVEMYFKALAVETNVRDGVFRISQRSVSNIIRVGLYYGLIDHVERDSAISDPDKILRIVKDTHEALQYLYDIMMTQQLITKEAVLKLHEILMRRQKVTSRTPFQYTPVGRFRADGLEMRRMEGFVQFCPPGRIVEEVQAITARIQELLVLSNSNPIGAAAWIHVAVLNCSPFADGNGRMARFLASTALIAGGLPPMNIPPSLRNEYASACSRARLEAHYAALEHVIARGIMETFQAVEMTPALTEEDYRFQSISGLEFRLSSIEIEEHVRDAVIQLEIGGHGV